ncbi:MAG: putative cytokinetic ring protein SteA, partial [Acidimicrobiales bacterium]
GAARVDRRTKNLLRRLQPGEVAVIDHSDLDRVAAEELIEAGVAGVVNAAASISGRYPNVGPLLLAAAGIPLVDRVGPEALDRIAEGDEVVLDGGQVSVGGVVMAEGTSQTLRSLEADYEAAKLGLSDQLSQFAENTLEYLRRERDTLLEPLDMPELRVAMRARHVLIVVRGEDHRRDLAHLRGYIREMRPVLVGVDGGADALVDAGYRPDLIIGDFDSVTGATLAIGAQLVVHAYRDGPAPGAGRLNELGLPYSRFAVAGTSEDAAMLLAYEQGAELIVAVGTHAAMVDFLDKGRPGMASTFLTRLKVGPLLVDAKGVSRLYTGRIRKRDLIFFLAAAMCCFVVIVLLAVPRVFLESGWVILEDLLRSLRS